MQQPTTDPLQLLVDPQTDVEAIPAHRAELVSVLDPPEDCEDVRVLLMASYRAFDCGEVERAEEFLDRASTSRLDYPGVQVEQALFD